MKSYTKAYMKAFGYDVSDFIPCEGCQSKAVDIHHLVPRSRDKSKLNKVSNLVALCRECHHKAETNVKFNEGLKIIHRLNMLKNCNYDDDLKKYHDESN